LFLIGKIFLVKNLAADIGSILTAGSGIEGKSGSGAVSISIKRYEEYNLI